MKNANKPARIAFILYVVLMLWLLFGQRMGTPTWGNYGQRLAENINLVPFKTLMQFVRTLKNSESAYLIRHAVINLGGNVVMFIPLGFLMPFIWQGTGRWKSHLKTSLCVITAIELIQLFTLLGSCDVDDLILNLIGTGVGFMLWKVWAAKGKIVKK